MVGHGCTSADVAVALLCLCSCATLLVVEGAGAHSLNCSFILCGKALPLTRARHFLCTVLATCFLYWELPGNLAT